MLKKIPSWRSYIKFLLLLPCFFMLTSVSFLCAAGEKSKNSQISKNESSKKEVNVKSNTIKSSRFGGSDKKYIIEQEAFFETYCKDSASNVAILKYNPLKNLLTDNKEGAHAYVVFSPTYLNHKFGLNLTQSDYEHICYELKDFCGNVYRSNSEHKVRSGKTKRSRFCDGVSVKAHGDCAVLNMLVKDKNQFKFEEKKPCTVRLFKNDNFDESNLLIEFEVVAEKATYNLFSRLGERTDFYKEFAHPSKFDSNFYLGKQK